MKIISWNVNGIRSRIFNNKLSTQHKKNTIINLESNSSMSNLILQYDPDIICLQETRCDEINGNFLKLDKYLSYFNSSKLDDARGPNRYSGTAIYTKIEPNNIEYILPDYDDQEGRIMIAHYNDFVLINVYAPNSGSNYENKIKFNNAFLEYFKLISKPLIFCGDMNMAIDTWFDKTKVKPMPGIYKHELEFFDKLTKVNTYGGMFNDAIDCKNDLVIYTWWDPICKKCNNKETGIDIGVIRYHNRGWRLDYFFTRMFSISKSKVLKEIGEENSPQSSDHAPVLLECYL
tara:strand:- start:140 stop:1006 length:867 start_codon:yes stop_codon:yes gene_type:complete